MSSSGSTPISASTTFTPSLLRQVYFQTFGVSSLTVALLTLRPSTLLSIPPLPALQRLIHPSSTSTSTSLAALDTIPEVVQLQHTAGVFLLGIATGYILSLWNKQYEFIYITVPVRLAISAATIVSYVVRPDRVNGLLVLIALVDGLGAIPLALKLGFGGVVPGSSNRKGNSD